MSSPGGRASRGPVAVATAVAGPTEAVVAASLSGRRDIGLVRRCADVAELLSVAEAGLAAVAVVGEAFPGLDADVVDRVRRLGCAVVGVVDPDRESSERLRAWGVPVVDVSSLPPVAGSAEPVPSGAGLVDAVLAAGSAPPAATGRPGYSSPDGPAPLPAAGDRGPTGRARPRVDGPGPADAPGPVAPGPDTLGSDQGLVRGERTGPHGAGPDGLGLDGTPLDGTAIDGTALGGTAPDGTALDEPHADLVGVPSGPAGSGAEEPLGRVVAVWGPAGAPGRTTVAVSVAAELAADGAEVLLVDADTYAASVAQVLGLLDEAPGLVAAVRAGLDGRLDPHVLARLAPTVAPGLRVLTGLSRAARWSELRPAGLEAVLVHARRLVDHVVVDLAPPLEEDDELSYDTAAPRRNGAALEVLRAADDVLVVGSADPVGLQRLVRGLQDLAVAVPGTSPQVVVNRVRADAVGRNPRLRVREALDRFAGVRDLRLVPDDRAATDRALLAGRTLAEIAPDSPARVALRATAAGLARPASRRAGRSVGRAGEQEPDATAGTAAAGGTGRSWSGPRGRRAGRRRATGG